MRNLLLIGSVALASATSALADIPPPQPEHPLGEACQPFIGVWHRVEPHHDRGGKVWWVIAIDSERATVLNYGNQENINIQAKALSFALTCTKNDDGTVTLDFGDKELKQALTATPVNETSFTTIELSSYLGAGPPDPNWKPEPLTITWVRDFR